MVPSSNNLHNARLVEIPVRPDGSAGRVHLGGKWRVGVALGRHDHLRPEELVVPALQLGEGGGILHGLPLQELVPLLQIVGGDAKERVGRLLGRDLRVVGHDQDGGEAVAWVGPRAQERGLGALAERLHAWGVTDRMRTENAAQQQTDPAGLDPEKR